MGESIKSYMICSDGKVGWNCWPAQKKHHKECMYYEELSDKESGDDRRAVLVVEGTKDDSTSEAIDFAAQETLRKAHAALDESPWPAASGSVRRATTRKSLESILTERMRQDKRWGIQNHNPDRWVRILMEEVGEFCEELDNNDLKKMRFELVQVAAVALAMLECLDRGQWDDSSE